MNIPFRYRDDLKNLDLIAIAAADLGKLVMTEIVHYRGNFKQRAALEIQV